MLNKIDTLGENRRIITKEKTSICAPVTCIYDRGNRWRILQISSHLHKPPISLLDASESSDQQFSNFDFQSVFLQSVPVLRIF